jgi:hypothetical protein
MQIASSNGSGGRTMRRYNRALRGTVVGVALLGAYARGGVHEVLRELRDERHFPGMQPIGVYPIHIIVKNGRTMLLASLTAQRAGRLLNCGHAK